MGWRESTGVAFRTFASVRSGADTLLSPNSWGEAACRADPDAPVTDQVTGVSLSSHPVRVEGYSLDRYRSKRTGA